MKVKTILLLISLFLFYKGWCQVSYLELAENKERQGKKDTALYYLNVGLSSNLSNSVSYKLLVKKGYILMSQGQDKEAEISFDKAIAILSDSGQAYAAKGYLFLKTKRFFKSSDNFDKAIARKNADISVIFCRAHALWDTKNYEEAMKGIDKVLLLQPNHPDANYLKGRIYARTGKHQEALPWYNKAFGLAEQSKIAEIYAYRGVSYLALNQLEKAESDLTRGIEGGIDRDEINFALMELDRLRK
ncbi:MAG: tetratricopeptide repeat protein [Bacteroidota bacterium]|nr:tetratricopeptide repeat protein [Bacteroidota bacterium]